MIFTATKYQLQTVATGRVFEDQGWTLDDKECVTPSMVRPIYEQKQLDVKKGACLGLYRYADWLPIKTMLSNQNLSPTRVRDWLLSWVCATCISLLMDIGQNAVLV